MNGLNLINNWLEKASDDLTAAKHLFENTHPKLNEIACYHSQQSVEKSLKGFLLFHGVKPPHSHNLIMLCQMCAEINNSFLIYQDVCSVLTTYATTTRYPDDEVEISEDNARVAINAADKIYKFCHELVIKP